GGRGGRGGGGTKARNTGWRGGMTGHHTRSGDDRWPTRAASRRIHASERGKSVIASHSAGIADAPADAPASAPTIAPVVSVSPPSAITSPTARRKSCGERSHACRQIG